MMEAKTKNVSRFSAGTSERLADAISGLNSVFCFLALMHVMNALVSHGVLLVDLTDGGSSFKAVHAMAEMWKTTESFFEQLDEETEQKLPGMTTATETGSRHAKVGYVSYDNGSLKFLETRRERKTGKLLPEQASELLGPGGISALQDAFDVIAQVGKDVIRIATAASSVEHGAFQGMKDVDDTAQRVKASQSATLLANEIVDDGKSLETTQIENNEGTVSMSPHRLCCYSDQKEGEGNADAREVFGAHTDSSFVTMVPVASVSGLEVFDEDADKWYRPELKARSHWQKEQTASGKDPDDLVDVLEDGAELPWHARYIAVIAGEHLQLVTRDEVGAGVHRVVAAKGRPARLSAPILLRGRPGIKFQAKRYLGGTLGDPLMEECDGKTMEDIHTATQPTSFQ
jgi:hypothetical protein